MKADTLTSLAAPLRLRLALPTLVWPALLLAVLLLPALLPPPHAALTVDIGAEQGIDGFGNARGLANFFGFAEPESGTAGERFRWSDEQASLALPYAFQLGSPLRVALRACGCRPPNTPPAQATLRINAAPPFALPLENAPRRYLLLVPARDSIYGSDLFLDFASTTFADPANRRTLGLALDAVQAAPLNLWSRLALPPLAAWLLYALVVAGYGLLVGREQHWGRDLSRPYNEHPSPFVFRLSSFVHGIQHGAFSMLLLSLPYLYRPHIFGLLPLALLFVAGSYMLVLLRTPPLHRLALMLALLLMLGAAQQLGHWLLDDAYISFRYAQNMLAGHGLVFNPGERVEGYTNFLWTMLLALPMALGYDPTMPALLLTLAIGMATVLLTYLVGKRMLPNAFLSLLAPLLLAVSGPFLLYTAQGSGMEAALCALLLTLGIALAWYARSTKGLIAAGIVFALATMTRPDALLGAVAVGAALVLRSAVQADRQRLSSFVFRLSSFALAFCLAFLPYYLWRYSYYGYPLPNTFYAKVGSGWLQTQRGLGYAGELLAQLDWWFGLALLLAGPLVALLRWQKTRSGVAAVAAVGQPSNQRLSGFAALRLCASRTETLALPLWLFVLLHSAYVVYVGGDHFPGLRFFVPIWPALCLLIQHGTVSLASVQWPSERFTRIWQAAVLLLAVGYLGFTASKLAANDTRVVQTPIWGEQQVTLKNRELGLWLRANAESGSVVATGIAGALPFYSGLATIDILGLNDLHIAHLEVADMGAGVAGAEKTDVPYVLARKPTYIPFTSSGFFSGYAQFQRDYELIAVRGPEGRAVKFYRLKTQSKKSDPATIVAQLSASCNNLQSAICNLQSGR